MSFLKTLKGTFTSVQKDISKSFKSFKKSDGGKPIEPHIHLSDGEVSVEAGADLLHRYEESWAEIHQSIEQSARAAKKIDIDVSEICVHYERQTDALKEYITSLSSLPDLTKEINAVVATMGLLEEDFVRIENMLLMLEDVCEQQELLQNKQKHQGQLEVYRHQKDIEVEQTKVDLAKAHALKVQAHETKLQECLREKQRAIEDTHHYEDQLKNYKLSGETNLKPQSSMSSSDADLADICVEDDNSALEEFLGDVNTDTKEDADDPVKESDGEDHTLEKTNTEDRKDNDLIGNDDDNDDNTGADEEDSIAVTPDSDFNQEDLISDESPVIKNTNDKDQADHDKVET